MSLIALGLDKDIADKVVRGVACGEYSLLLGAGFSLGAQSKGRNLPKSDELAQELVENFKLSLEVEGAQSLPLAYEDAEAASGLDKVNGFFANRLTGCVPKWHSVVNKFRWRRAWTLNIDDLPETIFGKKAVHIHFDEDFRPFSVKDGIQIVYLHGRAAARARNIFSIQEYHNSVRAPGKWHTAFFSEFNERPFIACGASLVGEFDLATTLRTNNESSRYRGVPSLAVVKGISPSSASRLRDRLGLEPVDCTGEDFFKALLDDVNKFSADNPGLVMSHVDPNHAQQFGRQFRLLDAQGARPPNGKHDFYAGDEPLWNDIILNYDAQLSSADFAVKYISSELDSKKVPVVGLFGAPGSGKSTSLLRSLRELSKFGAVYIFRNEDGLSVDSALACLDGQRAVIAFDDVADITVDVADLIKKARDSGMSIGVLMADRKRRERGVSHDISGYERLDSSILKPKDAIAIVAKRRSVQRLGKYAAWSDKDLRKYFIQDHNGDLFSASAALELGKGYRAKLEKIVNDSTCEKGHELLVASVALTHRWGYPLPVHYCSVTSGLSVAEIGRLCGDDGLLGDLLANEQRGIRFRHRVLAEKVFDQLFSRNVLADISKTLIAALAPLVNIAAIRAKSYEHRICRVLMERHSVLSTVENDTEAARRWYNDVEPFFDWNSRYWEQRALMENDAGSFSAAYSFAHAAVAKEDHPFPLTTLATVCFSYAIDLFGSTKTDGWDKYIEATNSLNRAFEKGRFKPETLWKPVSCYFDYAVRISDFVSHDPGMRRVLISDWERWLANGTSIKYFDENAWRLDELKRNLLSLSLKGR